MLEPRVVAKLLLAAGLPAGALMSTRSDQATLAVPGGLWLTRPGLIQVRPPRPFSSLEETLASPQVVGGPILAGVAFLRST